ncbi:M15 family metallopeptidase [Salipiger sp.]|uniref:M15 family metallopeptidase n=1 Tax=Salipiger sp. TaxID=2078585 RepID=UPI003A974A4A
MASADQLRHWWRAFDCNETAMESVPFCGTTVRVAPGTASAWEALQDVLTAHGYEVRSRDTGAYNCRTIAGTTRKSLHAFGIALDVNWDTNPFKDHAGIREVVFSDKPTQQARAADVAGGGADTDMTPGMIADILAIRTVEGIPVFEWGGTWNGVKDAMHFELDLSPGQLARGIETASVNRAPALAALTEESPATSGGLEVTARSGLNLRGGPGTDHAVLALLDRGTVVHELGRSGDWVMVSLKNDGIPDGFVHGAFLAPAGAAPPPMIAVTVTGKLAAIAADDVVPLFDSSAASNVRRHWSVVRAALAALDLDDTAMGAMAVGTIRAETAGFVPISEFRSKFNTKTTPFDLYDAGTSIGKRLGNTHAGDGPRFKGRGFVQLTGRFNYANIGKQIGRDLLSDPELANDPELASAILARFLKNKEDKIRNALSGDDLKTARKLVNGGSHGLAAFTEGFRGFMSRFG